MESSPYGMVNWALQYGDRESGIRMGREENVTVFRDTEKLCKNNKQLAESIRKSIAGQKLILESENIERLLYSKFCHNSLNF